MNAYTALLMAAISLCATASLSQARPWSGRHLNKITIVEPADQPFITETTTGSFIVAGKGAQFTNAKEIIPNVKKNPETGVKNVKLTVAQGTAAVASKFNPEAKVTFGFQNNSATVTSSGTDAFGKPKFSFTGGQIDSVDKASAKMPISGTPALVTVESRAHSSGNETESMQPSKVTVQGSTNATVDPTTLLGNAKQTASVTFGSTSGINYENQTTSGEIKVTSPNGKTLYDTQKTTSQSGGR